MLRGVLEGILFRLHPLVQGAAARQYAAGADAIDINEVVPGDWGVAILEGGAFLDEFSKAFLLGWRPGISSMTLSCSASAAPATSRPGSRSYSKRQQDPVRR